jgi:hypothetical protein
MTISWEQLKEEIESGMTEDQREYLRILEIKFQKETEELKKRLEEKDE